MKNFTIKNNKSINGFEDSLPAHRQKLIRELNTIKRYFEILDQEKGEDLFQILEEYISVVPNFQNILNLQNLLEDESSLMTHDDELLGEVLNYHIRLSASYILQDIFQQEINLLEVFMRYNSFNEDEKPYLKALQELKHQIFLTLANKNIHLELEEHTFIEDGTTPTNLQDYLDNAQKGYLKISNLTKEAVENCIINQTILNEKNLQFSGHYSIGMNSPQVAFDISKHAYGTKYYIKHKSEYNSDNAELLSESVADLITAKTFPNNVSAVRLLAKNLTEKSVVITGLRSKEVLGTPLPSYVRMKENAKRIENFEEYISKVLILLDYDSHSKNVIVKENKLIKIDNGRAGWLNFSNFKEIDGFISDRFIKGPDFELIPFNKSKLVNALVKDLEKINPDHIETSLLKGCKGFEVFPFNLPSIKSMNEYRSNLSSKIPISNQKEFVEKLSERYNNQHQLLKAYAVDQADKLGMKINNIIDESFIQDLAGDINIEESHL